MKLTIKLVLSFLFFPFAALATASTDSTASMAAKQVKATPATQDLTSVVQINDPSRYNQVVAISDVHGMYNNLVNLLQTGQIIDQANSWIAGKTLLIIVGDSINKGPQSIEVLNLWMQLQEQASAAGGRVIHLLGNHEAEFLANPTNSSKAVQLLNEMSSQHLPLSDLAGTDSPRGKFIHSEPVAARVGKWLFCHSGYFPDMSWNDFTAQAQQVLAAKNYGDDFLLGKNSILEASKWELNSKTVNSVLARMDKIGVYGNVFGHQPGAFKIKGRSAAKAQGRLIKIDNGMAPEGGSHPGSLLVFVNPGEMTQSSFPTIKIISANGTQSTLRPE